MFALRDRLVDYVVVFGGAEATAAARRKEAMKRIDPATEMLDKAIATKNDHGERVVAYNVWKKEGLS